MNTDTTSADRVTTLHAPRRPRPKHPIPRELGRNGRNTPLGKNPINPGTFRHKTILPGRYLGHWWGDCFYRRNSQFEIR